MAEPYTVHVDSALTDFAVAHFMEPNAYVARRAFPAVPVAKNADPGLNLEENKLKGLVQDMHIREEVEFATIAFASSWGTNTAPSPTWENAASYPLKDIATGVRTIQYNTGRIPNKLIVGAETWFSGLVNHSHIMGRAGDNAPRIATPGVIANLLGL